MSRPRWTKLRRDAAATRFRIAAMAAAIAVSLSAVGSLLTAQTVLTRELTRNYLDTRPASATLRVKESLDPATLRWVRDQPQVSDAAARQTVEARARVGKDTWQPLLLFVVPADDPLALASFRTSDSPWPAAVDTLFLERSAREVVDADVGGPLTVSAHDGATHSLDVAALAHDPALAPAPQERTGYAYITPETLGRLGVEPKLDELKIGVAGPGDGGRSSDTAVIEARARVLAEGLAARGVTVEEIQVPPPREHPHQSILDSMMALLMGAALVAFLLAIVLVATMLQALLARQMREIGVLKSIGARSSQILGGYLVMVSLIAAAATALAVWPSLALGEVMSEAVARMLNIDVVDSSPPGWVPLLVVAGGLLVPCLTALVPLTRASRRTVRETLDDHEVSAPPRRRRARSRDFGRTLVMAFRNAFRRKGRLVLTVSLVGAAGALLMTGLNTAAAWRSLTDDAMGRQLYDLEVRLDRAADAAELTRLVSAVPGVREAAPSLAASALAQPGEGVPVTAAYPDQAHGSFTAVTVDAERPLMRPALQSGRWLRTAERTGLVLNQQALARFPGRQVGDELTLGVGERRGSWRLVGVTEEIGPATAYLAHGGLDSVLGAGSAGKASLLRVVTDRQDESGRQAALADVEKALAAQGVGVHRAVPVTELKRAVEGHVSLLIGVVIAIAAVMAVVGLLGLGATMATNVTERTREFAVLRALGATPATVRGTVVWEALTVTALSTVLAVIAAVPGSLLVGNALGMASFRLGLPLEFSFGGLVLWTAAALVGGALVTWAAARRASLTPVREALVAV